MSTDILVWISIMWLFMAWSYLIKDNPLFRIVESTLVGVGIGHTFNQAIINVGTGITTPSLRGDWISVIGGLIGLLLFTRYIRGRGWIARYPTAIMWGVGSGLILTTVISSTIIAGVNKFITLPLLSDPDPFMVLGSWVQVISLVTVLVFFIFVVQHTGPVGYVARIGEYVLYLTYGIGVAQYVGQTMPPLLDRLGYVFKTWLQLA